MSIPNDNTPENGNERRRRRASSFLHLHIPEPAATWTAGVMGAITANGPPGGHHGFGSHLHLPMPTFAITAPAADGSGGSIGRKFSFGLRRVSQTVSPLVRKHCVTHITVPNSSMYQVYQVHKIKEMLQLSPSLLAEQPVTLTVVLPFISSLLITSILLYQNLFLKMLYDSSKLTLSYYILHLEQFL